MGLFQKAYETYEHHAHLVGRIQEGKEPLAPVAHIITAARIEITLDGEGRFIRAVAVDKSEPKIIIPVTEESAGRTSGICPHPLCDQIGYVSAQNEKKHSAYVAQLTDWAASPHGHPKLNPILQYVLGETLFDDLRRCGIEAYSEKDLIRWRVIDGEGTVSACWEDVTLFDAFIRYDASRRAAEEPILCMVSGERTAAAHQHLKGVISINGNAKLISANDTSNFTYRGRFTDESQAVTVGYEVSQKAHNALKWLAANQGVILGDRTFLCWNPMGAETGHPLKRFRNQKAPKAVKPSEYREDLRKALNSYRAKLPDGADVIIAAFDAATPGRLALTYYRELRASDFHERLHDWDASCCWNSWKYGIQSPSLQSIVRCAWGTERNGGIEVDKKIMSQHVQRLLLCRVDRSAMPVDIMQALVRRASSPLCYQDVNNREDVLFTACAVIRKYHIDRYQEEWDMALEPKKHDRSYQYGRLLAVMEKIERDTYDREETRETNAVRMQSVFVQRPQYAARMVMEQLKKSYYPRLKPGRRGRYERMIGEICEQIDTFPEHEHNAPLAETYLMGYYLQKNELYAKKDKENETEESEYEQLAE